MQPPGPRPQGPDAPAVAGQVARSQPPTPLPHRGRGIHGACGQPAPRALRPLSSPGTSSRCARPLLQPAARAVPAIPGFPRGPTVATAAAAANTAAAAAATLRVPTAWAARAGCAARPAARAGPPRRRAASGPHKAAARGRACGVRHMQAPALSPGSGVRAQKAASPSCVRMACREAVLASACAAARTLACRAAPRPPRPARRPRQGVDERLPARVGRRDDQHRLLEARSVAVHRQHADSCGARRGRRCWGGRRAARCVGGGSEERRGHLCMGGDV